MQNIQLIAYSPTVGRKNRLQMVAISHFFPLGDTEIVICTFFSMTEFTGTFMNDMQHICKHIFVKHIKLAAKQGKSVTEGTVL